MSIYLLPKLENLNTMIFPIANQNISIGHDGHALESFEFSIARSPRSERSQETAVRMENLYAIIARIGNAYESLVVHRHTTKMIKRFT